jgi:hypothetical protein
VFQLDPTATPHDLVALARSRWPIEQQYRELKDELGVDISKDGPMAMHHIVLTAVAFTFLQLERAHADDLQRPSLPTVRLWVREIMGLLYVINSRWLLNIMASSLRTRPYKGDKAVQTACDVTRCASLRATELDLVRSRWSHVIFGKSKRRRRSWGRFGCVAPVLSSPSSLR